MKRLLSSVLLAGWLVAGWPGAVPPAAAYGTGKQVKAKRRRPTLEYQRFRRRREVDVQMEQKRKAIREQLKKLLEYEQDAKERPALLFRLAENYFEEATAYFYRAQRLDEKLAADPTNESLRRRVAELEQALQRRESPAPVAPVDDAKVQRLQEELSDKERQLQEMRRQLGERTERINRLVGEISQLRNRR